MFLAAGRELCAVLSGKETGTGTRGYQLKGSHRGQRSAAFLGLGDPDSAHAAWLPVGSQTDPRLCLLSALPGPGMGKVKEREREGHSMSYRAGH